MLDLLESVYQGCLEPRLWSRAAEQLEKRTGALVALFLPFPDAADPGYAIAPSLDEASLRAYQRRCWRWDPGAAALASMPVGSVADVFASEAPEGERFEREWTGPLRLVDEGIVALLARDARGRAYALRAFPRVEVRATRVRSRALWESIASHFARALAIRLRLAQHASDAATFSRALDRIGLGVVSLDASCRIVGANATARAMLACGDALALAGEHVQPTSPALARQLRQLLAEAGRGASEAEPTLRALQLPRTSGRRSVTAVVAAVGATRDDARPDSAASAVLYLGDAEGDAAARYELVAQLFGLTGAESALLGRILEGDRVDEAAEHLGISPATARTRLKTIFLKTGVHRQAELVRLVLGDPAARLASR